MGAEVGDTLTLSFDLVAKDVTLSLGDDVALDEAEGWKQATGWR